MLVFGPLGNPRHEAPRRRVGMFCWHCPGARLAVGMDPLGCARHGPSGRLARKLVCRHRFHIESADFELCNSLIVMTKPVTGARLSATHKSPSSDCTN